MRLKNYLVEKLNLNYPVKDITDYPSEFTTKFNVGEEEYEFEANGYFYEDIYGYPEDNEDFIPDRHAWEIEFSNISKHPGKDRWGINQLMGTKGALQVFSGVATSLKLMIKKEKPMAFYFSAKEPSRIKLYNTFSKMIAKKFPYTVKKLNVPHSNTFLFTKN